MPRWTARVDAPIRRAADRVLPSEARRRLAPVYRRLSAWPPVGLVRFGSLRRVKPISREFGMDRGQPIDRYYIEDFLTRHTGAAGYAPGAIHGRVLEIGRAIYVERFGKAESIKQVDVLDYWSGNPNATIIDDLSDAPTVPSDAFDCVICTQTLLYIYDVHAAVRTLHRILKPSGTLLVTVPGISQICRPDMDVSGDYWRFTSLSLRRLLEESFRPEDVTVESYGNVFAAAAFLYGLAVADVRRWELDVRDPDYELVVAARAIKQPALD